ncbi:MAG: L-histidine N(alpha)-methyltransferase [Candidatus Cyclobacteriaceae bacterium M2_1C_046]
MKEQFLKDVLQGLMSSPKRLSSKYFYDAKGDKIFQKIMALPEYYLTRSEYAIFKHYRQELLKQFIPPGGYDKGFDLIELGAGDGTKTKVLLEYFLHEKTNFTYYPIDISSNVLNELEESLHNSFPELKVKGIPKEYFKAIKEVSQYGGNKKKVVLFLGSNIGNFDEKTTNSFLNELSETLNKGDMLLIGFDLKKHPLVIKKAYDDDAGVTREFNLNLLERINRELGANFVISNYMHYSMYNPESGQNRSYLLSKTDQKVTIADEEIAFDAWETIHTEISQKFDKKMINKLAHESNFEIIENYMDENRFFTDSLWRKK